MKLVTDQPFSEFTAFRSEVDSVWYPSRETLPFLRPASGIWLPLVDISKTKDEVLIKVALPGMDTRDIKVSITGDFLIIKDERKREEKDNNHYCVERCCGSFQPVLQLPVDAQYDNARATFKNCVLMILFPRVEEASKKEIKVLL